MAELAKLIEYTVAYERYRERCRKGEMGEEVCLIRLGVLHYGFDIRP